MELVSSTTPTLNPAPGSLTEPPADNALLRTFVRWRWLIFTLVALLQLSAFNNHWRIGRDGALYRTVAHSLVTDQGYTFRGERENHIFPGLPRLLAAIETVFGPQDPLHPTASLVILLAIAALTLVVIYHLVKTLFPPWIAVCVTTGVGINYSFMEQAHDFMTDVPFLLGVCLTLLGLAKFNRTTSIPRRLLALGLLLLGAILTVSMRPTFWALALPCVLLCLIGMVRSRRRLWYAAGILALLALLALWWLLDPRTTGFHPLAGKYERMALARLHDLAAMHAHGDFLLIIEKHFPIGILGVELIFPFGTLFFLSTVAWTLILFRKSPLVSLYILSTILMTFIIGAKARYYLMALPFILVTWALAVHYTAHWFKRWRLGPEILMLLGLGVATAPNVVRCIGFALEQHGIDYHGSRKPFLEVYRDGSMAPVYQISQIIRQYVPAGQRVLGIEDRITTYLSGRSVYQPTAIIQRSRVPQWRQLLRKAKVHYLVFGPDLQKEDPLLNKLLTRQVVEIDQVLFTQGGISLARIRIPDGPPPTRVSRHPRVHPPTTRPTTRRVRPHPRRVTPIPATAPATAPTRP
ncbi:MAG: hypothetical protein ACM359_20400 [Bacillota bacterium]